MSDKYARISSAVAGNIAATGEKTIDQAYLTRGPGSGVLVADAASRKVWYYQKASDGTARPPSTAFVSNRFNFQFQDELSAQYEKVLCDIGYEAGDSRLKILGVNAVMGTDSVGGVTPGEQAIASVAAPMQAALLDLRVDPAPGSVEFTVAPGTYYDNAGVLHAFGGATTTFAETDSIADQIAALSSGEHVIVWICLNTATGRVDTVSGTPETAAGTLPSRAEFNAASDFSGITITAPLKGLVPVYVYKTETASAALDIYRGYDARGAFGVSKSPGGATTASGTATLVLGVATVTTALVTASSRIFLTPQETGTYTGFLRVSARSAGVSFGIASSVLTDTAVVAWMILEP